MLMTEEGGDAMRAASGRRPRPMNVRLLRSSERTEVGRCRIWRGLGQMQPVLMGFERGRLTLRIEDVEGGRPCWRVLPLPWNRAEAKRLFAELEACHREGRRTPASEAWERVRPRPEGGGKS